MRFIVFALVQSPDGAADADVYRNETDLLVYAEDLGFDAVWMAEHHFHNYCITPDPLLLATHVAARTKRIRIGTAANVLPLSHPVRIAEQTAMLDILSEGRLDVGFAKGYGPREFMGYGVDQREAEDRFREALETSSPPGRRTSSPTKGGTSPSPRPRFDPAPAPSPTPAPTSPPPVRSRPSTSPPSSASPSTSPTGGVSTSPRSRSATVPRRRPTVTPPRRWTQPSNAPR